MFEEREEKGRGGGVRPAAVAMATTSRCCRSSGCRVDGGGASQAEAEERRREKRGEEPPIQTPPHLKPVAAPSALWVDGEATWRTRCVCILKEGKRWRGGGERGGGGWGFQGEEEAKRRDGREERGVCCYTEELAVEPGLVQSQSSYL